MYGRELVNTIKHIVKSIYEELGTGLLPSIYEECLIYELSKLDILIEKEVIVPIKYKELYFEIGCQVDLYLDNQLVIGFNREKLDKVLYKKHIENYMKHCKCSIGLFINFDATTMDESILVVEKKQVRIVTAPIHFAGRYYNNYDKTDK